MTEACKGRLATLAMFSPLALYLLALNPWFSPDQHDDVLYYFGAVSLLDGGGFALGGTPITDWPPGFPAALAGAMNIFGQSVWVAKLIVLAFAAFGIWMVYAVARIYALPAPRAVAALTALLPMALISGASVLSEWPYLALSMAFLYALQRLGETRTRRWVVVAGALLALASLTRFVGVFLGAAIVVQAWHLARRGGVRALLPEAVVAMLGAGPWLLWKLRCQAVIAAGEAPSGAYDNIGYYLDRFGHIEPLALAAQLESLLFSFGKVGASVLGAPWLAMAFGLLCGFALLAGAALRLRRGGVSPAGAYVLVSLLVLLGDQEKPERYFIPLAPFLIAYLLTAAGAALHVLAKGRAARFAAAGAACWMAWLVALDAYVLFVGNNHGTRGGFSMLSSRGAEDFYRGEPRDLYLALSWAHANAPPGAIAASGFHGKYVLAFTGREYMTLPDHDPSGAVALVCRAGEVPEGWEVWDEFGAFVVCHRAGD